MRTQAMEWSGPLLIAAVTVLVIMAGLNTGFAI